MAVASVFAQFLFTLDAEVDKIARTPFTQFYGTNYNTSSSIEKSQIGNIIEKITTIVHEIDSVVERLAERKASLESMKREHSRFCSVMGRVPGDVLSIIFEYSIPSHTRSRSGFSQFTASLSFNVSGVCQWWRTVALRNPKLWNKIYLDASKVVPNTRYPRFTELASRCRLHPTHLMVHNANLSWMSGTEHGAILEALKTTCQGLELRFSNRNGLLPRQLDEWLSRQFPNLASLSLLSCHLSRQVTANGPPLLAFSQLSNLHVHFAEPNKLREHGVRAIYYLHLPHLQRLIVHTIQTSFRVTVNISRLATSFPGLEELRIHVPLIKLQISRTELAAMSQDASRFSQLKVFSLITSGGSHHLHIFKNLVLPSLSELNFPLYFAEKEGEDPHTIEALFARSHCPLKRMNVINRRSESDRLWVHRWIERLQSTYPQLQLVDDRSYEDINGIKAAWYS